MSQAKNPFKSEADFEKDMKDFSNRHKVIIADHAKRISDYFEMSCYNMILRFYENTGYKIECKNLIGGKYRFKCSPAGIQKNFSFFTISKDMNGLAYTYDIYHNVAVQSYHDDEVFTTPDITISKANSVPDTNEYYLTKKTFSYIKNDKIITFFEVKNFAPFPEIILNFIGVVNELLPSCLQGIADKHGNIEHIAPSLMLSGLCNKPTKKIKNSLERRYVINIFDDLFNTAYSRTFSKANIDTMITTLAKKKPNLTPK